MRSDSVDATANHSLVINNVPVDQAALAATTFVDSRELQGADCMFDGNPLYAGEHAGTLKISTVHGAVIAEIPGTSDLAAIAVEHPNGQLWTLRGNTLRAFDASGAETRSLSIPITAPAGVSGRQTLALDSATDDIWVAIGPTLYRVHSGQVVGSLAYGQEIREISIENRSPILWVLHGAEVHIVKSGDDAAVPIAEIAHIALPSDVSAMTYDTYWGQTWIVAGGALRRYDRSGTLIEDLILAVPLPIEQLAADGAGGLWGTGANRLFHVQADGSISIEIEAFASGTTIVDLATDPADGTAWVAAGSHVRHFGRDGALLNDLLPTLPDGSARQFRFLELFADRTPPSVRIVSPAEGATVSTSQPTLQLEYSDVWGRGVAEATLELWLEDQRLSVDCNAGPESALCVPTTGLNSGEVTITPRIFDLAGNESEPRPHTFTIRTATQPQVFTVYPYDGTLTNTPIITVQGWIADATDLTLNGATVAVGPDNWFFHEVHLLEGANSLTLIASDASGASTQLIINVTLDTVPPALPDLSLLQVRIDRETGYLLLSAAPGAFEPFAQVRIFNPAWSYATYVVANEDGSLSATVFAEPGQQLFINVGDAAGNQSEQVAFPYAIDQLTLTITSPFSPVSVESRDLVIRGKFSGPAATAITANGVVAALSGNSGGGEFAVRVRLAPGENAIQVVATAPGRPPLMQEIVATRIGAPPFRIKASETEGFAPLTVEFGVERFDETSIQRVEVDFEGDGGTDTVSEGSRVGTFVHEYLTPGRYTAVFRIRTSNNTLFTYEVPVVVHTAEEVNLGVQAAWQRFRTALAAGDAGAALECMMPKVAARYSNALTNLQSSLPQIVTSFSDIYPTGAPGLNEYVLMRDVNGQPTAFLIYFARGTDGVWRIASM